MPKKKVDSQQGIRLELQESERNALKLYTASTAFKNVGVGVGAVLKPIADNFAVLMAAWLAKEGMEGIQGTVEQWHINAEVNKQAARDAEYQEYIDNWEVGKSNMTDSSQPWTYDQWYEISGVSRGQEKAEWWQEKVGKPLRNGIGTVVNWVIFWD